MLIASDIKNTSKSLLFFLTIIIFSDLVCQPEFFESNKRSLLLALRRIQEHQAALKNEINVRERLHEMLQKDLYSAQSLPAKNINIGSVVRAYNATPVQHFNPPQAGLCQTIDTTSQLLYCLNYGSLQDQWEIFHNLKEEGSVTLSVVNKYSQIVAGMELSILLDATVVSPQSLKNFLEQQRKIAVIKLQTKTKQIAIVNARKAVNDSQHYFDKANFDLAALQSEERCFALQGIAKNFKGHVGNWQKIIQQRKIAEEQQLADREQEQHFMAVQEEQTRMFLQEEKKQRAQVAKKARKKLPKVQDPSESSELDELITQFTARDKLTESSIDPKAVVVSKKKIDKVACENQRKVYAVLDRYKELLRNISDCTGKKEIPFSKITQTFNDVFELQEQLAVRSEGVCDYISVEQYGVIKNLYDKLGQKLFLHQADNISAFLCIRKLSLQSLEQEIAELHKLLEQAEKERNVVFVNRYTTDLAERNKRKKALQFSCNHYQKLEQQKFVQDYFKVFHCVGAILNPTYKSINFHKLPEALSEFQLKEMLDPIKKDFKALKIASKVAPDKVDWYNRSITAKLQDVLKKIEITEIDRSMLPKLFMTTADQLAIPYLHNLLNRQSIAPDIYEKLRLNNDVIKEYSPAVIKTIAIIQSRLIKDYAEIVYKKS